MLPLNDICAIGSFFFPFSAADSFDGSWSLQNKTDGLFGA